MLVLYQTEWCPFSAAVRELLTELGVDFVARPVEPWPQQRAELRALAGTDAIPVLQADDGSLHRGTREIFAYLATREPGRYAVDHRRRYAEHREARVSDTAGRLLAFAPVGSTGPPPAAPATPNEPVVVDVPEENRYELRLDGRRIGFAAYRRRPGRIAFTHTEVDDAYGGRGFGTQLALAALEDARREGLKVAPYCPFIAHVIEQHPEYAALVERRTQADAG